MGITFVESQVFNDCYHAFLGKATVGMVIKGEDGRWRASAYRKVASKDMQGSFTERSEAEEFVRMNAVVPVED